MIIEALAAIAVIIVCYAFRHFLIDVGMIAADQAIEHRKLAVLILAIIMCMVYFVQNPPAQNFAVSIIYPANPFR